jgi:hypothetical protein
MSSFIEKCVLGEVLLEEIDDFVERWHSGHSELPLHSFLGMTRSEYSLWVADPAVLPFIVTAHKTDQDVGKVLDRVRELPMAARADGPEKAKKLLAWLKREGLWP